MRVYELAKELNLSNKDVIDKLLAMGIQVKQASSAVDEELAGRLRAACTAPASAAPTAPAPAAVKAVAPPVSPAPVQPAPAQPDAPATPAPKPVPAAPEAAPAVASKVLMLKGPVVVRDLAELLGVRPNQLIAELMRMSVLASINERIEIRDASRIAEKHGFTVEREKKVEHKPLPLPKKPVVEAPEEAPDTAEDNAPRPPVVTFMGHVDHGKTSLLDRIRNAQVAKGEAGGITQHIGAYTVKVGAQSITFLDTPGHKAFTAMRARGANMTDIAVIVIAADDGVMPQTNEAIKHAEAAQVQIMVAINKIDLPAANVDRIKQQLAQMGHTPEDWGGKVICCPVSAQTGQGVKEMLDMILLQSEIMELRANPRKRARGYVIEAQLESGMGPTCNLLVANGSLRVGDVVLCGPHWGRVRALLDDHGKKVQSAGPSIPVKCLGLSGVPDAGSEFHVCDSDRECRAEAEQRQADLKRNQLVAPKRASLDTLFEKIKEEQNLELKLVLKADVQGSLEAIQSSLLEIKSSKVSLHFIMGGVGNIPPNDVLLASASDAVILGFHVSVEDGAVRLAKQEGVEIRLHSIIYELIDQVRDAMAGLLTPEIREKVRGHAEVKQVFTISKGGVVAGCLLTDGLATPRLKVRVKREGSVVFEGSIASLRRFQNDVSEVRETQECGIRLDNFAGFAAGDTLEFYELERITPSL
jgi:translation initiation factor IF-2